jgi:hypothetical protein
MKILLIAKGRCGSHSLMDWIIEKFNLIKVSENDNKDILLVNDYIIKRHPTPDLITDGYDYVIRLIRENTILCAESDLWAFHKQKYHPDEKEKYIIDEGFLINHHKEIWDQKDGLDQSNDVIRNMDVGLFVTYEEIFIHGTGQEKIENYMGFKSNSKLDTDDMKGRLHVIDKTLYTTYDIEYKKMCELVSYLRDTLKERETTINNQNKIIDNKKNEIITLVSNIRDNVTTNEKNILIKNIKRTKLL